MSLLFPYSQRPKGFERSEKSRKVCGLWVKGYGVMG